MQCEEYVHHELNIKKEN